MMKVPHCQHLGVRRGGGLGVKSFGADVGLLCWATCTDLNSELCG